MQLIKEYLNNKINYKIIFMFKKKGNKIKPESTLKVNIRILKLIIFFIISFLIIADLKIDFFEEIINVNKTIIESKYYRSFDNMKRRFMKDPILKDYLSQISIIKHIYNKNNKFIKMKKNNVHICASLNDRYVYPLLVSIESVLINCNKQNIYITYYVLCAPDTREITLLKLQSLLHKYPLNLELIFIIWVIIL